MPETLVLKPPSTPAMELLKPPEVWVRKYRSCADIPQGDPEEMAPEEIKSEILTLLFDSEFQEKVGAVDRELLTIVIVREKAHFFDFLQAYTKWRTVGMWKGKGEPNVSIEIEFRDTPNECVGNRLMHLLWAYNQKLVREELLYARTAPIEEGTLFP